MGVLEPFQETATPGQLAFKADPELEKRIRDYCSVNAVIFSEISRRLWVAFLDEKEKN